MSHWHLFQLKTLPFLLLALLCLSSPTHADTPASTYSDDLVKKALELKLDQDPYWRILLHYRSRLFGGWKSEVDGRAFFNSPEGRKDPAAELEATIRAFFEPEPGDPAKVQQAQCRFIDRYRWLKPKLGFDPARLPERPCPQYEEWRHVLDPESLTVVFSSYYMNNPSSVFGHTLLRLNHRNHTDQDRLLDYGVNYAANATTSNAFLYGFLGLTGGFTGDFSNIPYYLKVQEYNDLESRDLWEYDLNLDAEQIDRLMLHLWTVGRVPISYYFLDRNCSYMMLTLLDAAQPALMLSDEFQTPWVIPADTIRIIASRPDLIRRVGVRPSLSARIRQQRDLLSPEQRERFYDFVGLESSENITQRSQLLASTAAWPPAQAAPVLDLTLDHLRLLKSTQKGKLEPQQLAFQRELLSARASIDQKPVELPVDPVKIEHARPDLGHRTKRVELGLGYNELRGGFAELGWRSAFHDLSANPQGYPAHAQIEVLALQLRYYPRDQWLRLERADLVNILSLAPLDPLFKRISWGARIGADPIRDFDSGESLEYKGNVGAGASLEPVRGMTFFALGRAEIGLSGAYVPNFRLGPAAVAGTQISLVDWLGLEAWVSYSKPLLGYTPAFSQASAQARLSLSSNAELRLQGDLTQAEDQGKFFFHVYF